MVRLLAGKAANELSSNTTHAARSVVHHREGVWELLVLVTCKHLHLLLRIGPDIRRWQQSCSLKCLVKLHDLLGLWIGSIAHLHKLILLLLLLLLCLHQLVGCHLLLNDLEHLSILSL